MLRLSAAWHFCAILLLNTVLLLLVLNGAFALYFLWRDSTAEQNMVLRDHGSTVYAAYPGVEPAEVNALLDETWGRQFIFAPFVQFREAPFKGNYVTVAPAGYREIANQAPWPLSPEFTNVFVFGGSTTFGYGVRNDESIPSYLQAFLRKNQGKPAAVYNFGQSAYFSAQERVLFEQLLLNGHKPDAVVFIDGLNEFASELGEPYYSEFLAEFMNPNKEPPGALNLSAFALGRALLAVQSRMFPAKWERPAGAGAGGKQKNDGGKKYREVAEKILSRYFENKKIIAAVAAANDIEALFVWQAVPLYLFDGKHYPFKLESWQLSTQLVIAGYELMQARVDSGQVEPNFVWLVDTHLGADYPLYVDRWHYSARHSETIARRISEEVRQRGMLD